VDVRAHGVGARADRFRGLGRRAIGVDPHVVDAGRQRARELVPQRRGQWLTGSAGRRLDERLCGSMRAEQAP